MATKLVFEHEGRKYALPKGISAKPSSTGKITAFSVHRTRNGVRMSYYFPFSDYGSVWECYRVAMAKLAEVKTSLPVASTSNVVRCHVLTPYREDMPGVRRRLDDRGRPCWTVQLGPTQSGFRTRVRDLDSPYMELMALACLNTARYLYTVCNEVHADFDWHLFSKWREQFMHPGMFVIDENGMGDLVLRHKHNLDQDIYTAHSVETE